MVLHACNRKSILEEPLKYRAASEILWALTALYKHIIDRGIQPRLHMLDIERLAGMRNYILSTGAQHQLVPPGLYRALILEREIQTSKHHFIDGLSSWDPKFLLQLWCCLIQQAVLTLNHLRPEK